jgi:hypothetical protein
VFLRKPAALLYASSINLTPALRLPPRTDLQIPQQNRKFQIRDKPEAEERRRKSAEGMTESL